MSCGYKCNQSDPLALALVIIVYESELQDANLGGRSFRRIHHSAVSPCSPISHQVQSSFGSRMVSMLPTAVLRYRRRQLRTLSSVGVLFDDSEIFFESIQLFLLPVLVLHNLFSDGSVTSSPHV